MSDLSSFSFDNLKILYSEQRHLRGIAEVFFLDIYTHNDLSTGDNVIDVGAGIGEFTVLASKMVGESGRVLAIEPNPDDFSLLTKNISMNKCENVVPLNIAVSDVKRKLSLEYFGKRYEFDATDFDSLVNEAFPNDERINLLKMDVEGFEVQILSCDPVTLRRVEKIAIELHGTKQEIDTKLFLLGFHFKRLKRSTLYSKILLSALKHPILLYDTYKKLRLGSGIQTARIMLGNLEITRNEGLLVGYYLRQ